MKLITLIALTFCFQALATEVETDCMAMSENREKVIKTAPVKSEEIKSGGAIQG